MKNKVRELAENRKIKLDILAEKAELSKTTIYSIARGSSIPTISNAYKIAKILEVPVQDVFIEE